MPLREENNVVEIMKFYTYAAKKWIFVGYKSIFILHVCCRPLEMVFLRRHQHCRAYNITYYNR